MRTKQDVQLELLKEIDDICEQNNLKYFLFSRNALNVYLNHTIKNGARVVCIAMTQGDIDRFCKIVEKNNDGSRYVEGMFNNPRCNYNYVSYGNANTTDFQAVNLNYNKNHGIRIRIYSIDSIKPTKSGKLTSLERKFRKLINTRIISPKLWFITLGLNVLYSIYSLLGCPKRYYNRVKAYKYIDTFEDIQKYETVRISKNEINTSSLTGVTKVDVDGYQLCVPEDYEGFLADCFGEDFKNRYVIARNQKFRNIIDTERGYDEVIAENKDIIRKTRCCYEDVLWTRLRCKHERDTVVKVWRLVQMTNKQVEFIHFFEENKDRIFAYDINDEEEFALLYSEIYPVIKTLTKYARYGMTFSITPEVDEFIQNIMNIKGRKATVMKINLLKKKKYFVK